VTVEEVLGVLTLCLALARAVTGIVVLPASVVAGYQFPLLIALFGRGRERLGHQIGVVYASNTIGAIVGSLAGGFGLLPALSAPGASGLRAVTRRRCVR
jgi:predicted membrane-bound spermidine synthase